MFVLKSKYRELEKEKNRWKESKLELLKNFDNLKRAYYQLESKEFPRLTRCQSECLLSCLDCYVNHRMINVSMTRTAKYLKQLTDKGYLRRVKRGNYKLTFVK